MNEELIRDVNRLQSQVDGLIKPEKTIVTIDPFLDLPGLVGFWPMSSVQRSTGNAYDLSGQGRTLTYNGNPTYNIYNNIVPYISLDGVGDFLSRADETDLDILGTETIYGAAVRGLTMGIWNRTADVTPAASSRLIGKYGLAGQRSYRIVLETTGVVRGDVSVDGTAVATINSTVTLTDNEWFLTILRFVPSNTLDLFINGNAPDTQAVGVPASIFNSNSDFTIGARSGGGVLFTGDQTMGFLCANALSDALIGSLFQQTRVLFGV